MKSDIEILAELLQRDVKDIIDSNYMLTQVEVLIMLATLRSQMQGRVDEKDEEFIEQISMHQNKIRELRVDKDELKLKVDELKPYTQHKPICSKFNNIFNYDCTCGLDQILKTV